MKEFITFLLKQFVKNPDSVTVNEAVEGDIHMYYVTVADDDMGLVIGKEGKTINSIRNLVKAKAMHDNIMARVTLVEPEKPQENTIETDAN